MSVEDRMFKGAPYAALVHPDPAYPPFLAHMGKFVEIASRAKPGEIGRLIRWKNWRHRLVGQSIGALTKYRGFESDLLASLASPNGWSLFGAAAALAVTVRRKRAKLLDRDFAACDRLSMDGDVGKAIDAAIAYVDSGEIAEPHEMGGPQFKNHVPYHEWLWDHDHQYILQVSKDSSNDTWSSRERSCPCCTTRFVSVQNLGRCPSCDATFFASAPLFCRRGS